MRRRELIAALAAAFAAWPRTLPAQPSPHFRRLGILSTTRDNDPEWKVEIAAFLDAMKGLGWTEGSNLWIEHRFGAGDPSRLAVGAKALVEWRPDALLTRSTTSVTALLRETRTIPIIFVFVSDPVGQNFAASLARPSGNVTGFTDVESTMGGKWLELLKEIAPRTHRVGVLYNPKVAVAGGAFFLRPIEAAQRWTLFWTWSRFRWWREWKRPWRRSRASPTARSWCRPTSSSWRTVPR